MSPPPDWVLKRDLPADADRAQWWRRLPEAAVALRQVSDPAGYIPSDTLLDAFNTALLLGQPMLITGEPGCGKTEAANYLAWRLGLEHGMDEETLEPTLRYDVKSTTGARDLFYSFDVMARFHAVQAGDDIDPVRFISLNALGRAVVEACPLDAATALRTRLYGDGPHALRRSVVLIDEVDKAPRDTPNDLLLEFDKMRFHLPELNQTFRADAAHRPVVVMTSNSERALPEAFLRRCVFHFMPFPEKELPEIVSRRVGALDKTLQDQGIGLFFGLREARLNRKPGAAELISFFLGLKGMGLADSGGLKGLAGWHGLARTTLLKNKEDQERATDGVLNGLAAA